MRVLIAEDEYYARERLVKLLKESGEDMELAAAVEDGAAAVEFLEQHTDVDVVVTDIVMPRMGGLRLAEYVYRNMPYVQVVIVSGYEEFNYARKAIEYEVKQYLIKPVRKEEFLKTLYELGEKKENYRREVEEVVQERLALMPYGFPFSRQILGNRALIERYLPVFAAADGAMSRIAVIQLERPFTQEDAAFVHQLCMQRLQGMAYGGFFCKGEDEYVLAAKERQDGSPGFTGAVDGLLRYFLTRLDTGIAIGISRPFSGCELAADAYNECLYAMNDRLIKGWNQAFEYRGGRAEQSESPGGYFDLQDENMLIGALQISDYGRAAEVVHALLYKKELIEGGDGNALYDVVLNILRTVNKYYRSLYQAAESRVEIMFSRRYDLYSFKHPGELEDYLLGILQEICNYRQAPGSGGNAIVRDILHYVEHNYPYDLSLQELAEKKYFMNPSYLSRLFKSAVGRTFSRYVIDLRIKKARELLADHTLKINDIAAQVGYNNTSHFIRSFKKICGCTPEEMREGKV